MVFSGSDSLSLEPCGLRNLGNPTTIHYSGPSVIRYPRRTLGRPDRTYVQKSASRALSRGRWWHEEIGATWLGLRRASPGPVAAETHLVERTPTWQPRTRSNAPSKTGARSASPVRSVRIGQSTVGYRDVGRLKKYVSERGKIVPRRISGNCAKHQRMLTVADQARPHHRLSSLRFGVVVKLVLLADVKALGKKGDIVDVADGYARNYLLPRKLGRRGRQGCARAVGRPAQGGRAQTRARTGRSQRARRARIESAKLAIKAKAGGNGKLFGAVTNADVATAIAGALDDRDRQA